MLNVNPSPITPFRHAIYDLPISLFLSVGVLLVFFVSQILGIGIFANYYLPGSTTLDFGGLIYEGGKNGLVVSLSVGFTGIVILAFIALLIILKKGAKIADYLALQGFTGKQFLAFTSLLLGLNIIIECASTWLGLQPMTFLDKLMPTAQPLWLLVVAMVIIAPIYEEVIFRGFIWAGLVKGWGFWGASIATSLVFAGIHGQYTPIEGGMIVVLAMLFSWARATSNSLLLPIILHIMNNGLAMGLYLLGGR